MKDWREIKMAVLRGHRAHLSHTRLKYIKNTSMCGRVFTENLTRNWQKDICTT